MIHEVLHKLFSLKRNRFIKDSLDLRASQEKKLADIFSDLKKTEHYQSLPSPKELIACEPQSYSDFEPLIEQQLATKRTILCHDLVRTELTSGSTKNKKKILYSKRFLQELNEASTVWMADLYSRYPGIKAGPHYWTLSWSPQQDTDDSELFPWAQRLFLQRVLLLNQKIKSTRTLESSWFATLVTLVASKNLSLISIWSPTLLSRIKRDIQAHAMNLHATLAKRQWTLYAADLNGVLPVPGFDHRFSVDDLVHFNIGKIWPHLTLISAWDSSSSQPYYEELKKEFPGLNFQGKGLWATEGVITFPFEGQKVLSFKSHYYEFKCVQTGRILQSWQLEKGQIVEPLITSSNGLTRYQLEDRIQVSGFYNTVPCFEFLGRNATSDLVGEKLNDLDFQDIQLEVMRRFAVRRVLFFAVSSAQPHYYGLCDSDNLNSTDLDSLSQFVEECLLKRFNYQVARQLQQLAPASIDFTTDLGPYIDIVSKSYSAQGQFKVQPLYRISAATFAEIKSTFVNSFQKNRK